MNILYQKRGDDINYVRLQKSNAEYEKRYELNIWLNIYNNFLYIYNLSGKLKRINDIEKQEYSGYLLCNENIDYIIDYLNSLKFSVRYISKPQHIKSLYKIKNKIEEV